MLNMLITCSGGFSSSLVISKVKEAAKKKNVEVNAWAINCGDFKANIDKADIALVAPQIQFMYKDFKELSESKGKPCLLISGADYGRCDGEHIFELVQKTLNKKIGE